jgi:chromosome segregation ATPase
LDSIKSDIKVKIDGLKSSKAKLEKDLKGVMNGRNIDHSSIEKLKKSSDDLTMKYLDVRDKILEYDEKISSINSNDEKIAEFDAKISEFSKKLETGNDDTRYKEINNKISNLESKISLILDNSSDINVELIKIKDHLTSLDQKINDISANLNNPKTINTDNSTD